MSDYSKKHIDSPAKEWGYFHIACPCCGNCRHFERVYEDTKCKLQEALEDEIWEADIFPDEHGCCNKFERKEINND